MLKCVQSANVSLLGRRRNDTLTYTRMQSGPAFKRRSRRPPGGGRARPDVEGEHLWWIRAGTRPRVQRLSTRSRRYLAAPVAACA